MSKDKFKRKAANYLTSQGKNTQTGSQKNSFREMLTASMQALEPIIGENIILMEDDGPLIFLGAKKRKISIPYAESHFSPYPGNALWSWKKFSDAEMKTINQHLRCLGIEFSFLAEHHEYGVTNTIYIYHVTCLSIETIEKPDLDEWHTVFQEFDIPDQMYYIIALYATKEYFNAPFFGALISPMQHLAIISCMVKSGMYLVHRYNNADNCSTYQICRLLRKNENA